jgi:hypothetical protein
MTERWATRARTPCLTVLLLSSAVACGGPGASRVSNDEPSAEDAAGTGTAQMTLMPDSAIIAAQEELTETVMSLPGVTGTAVGLCGDTVCIKVLLARADSTLMERIPETFRGFKVTTEVSGEIRPR